MAVYLHVSLPTCSLPACLYTCMSTYLSLNLPVCVYLPVCQPAGSFYLPVCLLFYLSTCLSVNLPVCWLPTCLPVHQLVLSTCLSVYLLFCKHAYLLSTCLSVTHGFFLPVYLSTCPSVSLPVYCLHICTYVSQPAWSFCLRVCRLCINLIFIFFNSVFTTKSVITYFYKLDLTYVSWKL